MLHVSRASQPYFPIHRIFLMFHNLTLAKLRKRPKAEKFPQDKKSGRGGYYYPNTKSAKTLFEKVSADLRDIQVCSGVNVVLFCQPVYNRSRFGFTVSMPDKSASAILNIWLHPHPSFFYRKIQSPSKVSVS